MRTKSKEKRREIIRVAAQAFEELGYERTSMLTIAERLQGSKQTLYNHFGSKEELLRAVLEVDVGEVADQSLDRFLAEKNLRTGLTQLGEFYLTRQLAPLAVSSFRTVASLPADTGIGEDFYQNILCAAWKRLADAFKALMAEGKLRRADPWIAAMHFKGLVVQDLFERRLLNGANPPGREEIETSARHAADAFLRIYAKEKAAPRKAGASARPTSGPA
jgi:AcrR family transcriptional regulator